MAKKKNNFYYKNSPFFLILFLIIGILLFLLFTNGYEKSSIKFKNHFPKISVTPTLEVTSFSSKISTKNWLRYYSENLGVSIKYPPNWSVDEFSQGNDFILLFDSSDVKFKNTFKGGGIEISAHMDKLYDRVNTTLSPYQWVKEKSYTVPPYEETIYTQRYHALKFYVEGEENILYFDIPYEDRIFNMTIRYTDESRHQEAEETANEMLNSLQIY